MTATTRRSCIVHGPAGCGKSTHAYVIAKALGLSRIHDNWTAGAPVPLLDTLILTDADNPSWYFNGRVLTYDQAMQLVKYEKAIELSVPDAKHQAVAWLGQAGLYRTRFDAVRNFEQSIIPITTDELFNLASKQALSELRVGGQSACPCSANTNANDPEGHA